MFARTLGLPNDPVRAVRQLVAGIDAADIEPIGLGRVNGRYFCFHTGVGLRRGGGEPGRAARLAEAMAGPPAVHLRVDAHVAERVRPACTRTSPSCGDDEHGPFEVPDGFFTIVLNTNPYTYLGNRPLDLSPAATLDRGLVAVTFRSLKLGAVLGSLTGALRGGGVQPSAHLDVRTDLTHLTIRHAEPFPYQLDGDYLGETHELQFVHVPDAVRIVRPGPPPDE